MMATEKRISEQGTVFDAAIVRDFLLAALNHNAVIDRIDELLFEHVAAGKYHPSVIAGNLRPIIDEVLNTATAEDWRSVTDRLTADARATLDVEALAQAPGASPGQEKRRLRDLDPGELRERLAEIYSREHVSLLATCRAQWIIRRIRQLAGISREQIKADARADAEAINATDQSSEHPNKPDIIEVEVDLPNLFVRPLTSEEVDSLKFINLGHQADDLAACNETSILLGSNAGCTPSQIAAMLIVNEAKVREVIADFNKRGIAGIAETRQAEREHVIQTARSLDPESFDTNTREARPGKYEGASDLRLAVALDILNGQGLANESSGDVAISGYAWRVNRFVGIEDSQGFVRAEDWPTARQAAGRLRDFDVPTEDEES